MQVTAERVSLGKFVDRISLAIQNMSKENEQIIRALPTAALETLQRYVSAELDKRHKVIVILGNANR